MEEAWIELEEFPGYSVSSEGRIRNDRRERIVRPSRTRQGALKVGLVGVDGQRTRSLKVLVGNAFVEGRTDIFDTPMLLNGDQEDVRAANIVWRPRWFAWKYARQFETVEEYEGVGPVVDRKSGHIYDTLIEAALTNGILMEEITFSLVNQSPVSMTWQIFDWA